MARRDDLLQTIEAVHAAGLDEARWSDALAAIARLFGAQAATLEDFEKRPMRLLYLRTAGIPPQGEIAYLEHYARANSRAQFAFKNLSKRFLCDYEFTDERTMDRDPYYAKYLASLDLRYFLSGQIDNAADHQAVISIQRTRKQGHVGKDAVERMALLIPHVRQAYDVTKRLRTNSALEHALAWLSDGVALLQHDGRIKYSNEAFQTIVRRGDGLRLVRGMIEFAAAEARTRFAAAMGNIENLKRGNPQTAASADFLAPRKDGAPPYMVSLRPITASRDETRDAVAIVFVRDPLGQDSSALALVRDLLGLTEAEAGLALALRSGKSISDYVQDRGISFNTVYTHLRRIKEKTGCTRLPQLIQKLNDLRMPAREG